MTFYQNGHVGHGVTYRNDTVLAYRKAQAEKLAASKAKRLRLKIKRVEKALKRAIKRYDAQATLDLSAELYRLSVQR